MEGGFGPGVYPLTLVSAVIFLCIILFISTIRLKTMNEKKIDFRWEGFKTPLVFIGTILLFIVLMKPIGFLLDTFVLLLITLKSMKTRWVPTILTTLIAGTAVYAIFVIGLRMPFPTGTLFGG